MLSSCIEVVQSISARPGLGDREGLLKSNAAVPMDKSFNRTDAAALHCSKQSEMIASVASRVD